MANAREVKQRIRSVKNIAQVTRALQAVSASRVRKAMDAMYNTRPYANKAWQVLTHIAGQPGREMLLKAYQLQLPGSRGADKRALAKEMAEQPV